MMHCRCFQITTMHFIPGYVHWQLICNWVEEPQSITSKSANWSITLSTSTRVIPLIAQKWHGLTFQMHNNLRNGHPCIFFPCDNQESSPYRLCAVQYIHGVLLPCMVVTNLQIRHYWGRVWRSGKGVWMAHSHSHNKVDQDPLWKR